MSLLSLPNEVLINFILSRNNITISDLFQLMLSCRQLHNVIVDSNKLWMCKFSARWSEKYKQLEEKQDILWRNWVCSLRVIEEVKKAVTTLSSQCYPLGRSVTPVLAVEKWFGSEQNPYFVFPENELCELVFNEEMERDLTTSYYANVALKKLKNCLQVRNLNMFMAKSESQKTLLEGAKLISNWFNFSGDWLIDRPKLVDNVEQCLQKMFTRVNQLVKESTSTAIENILNCINIVLFSEMSFRVYKEDDSHDWNHEAASIHKVLEKRIGYPAVICVIYLEMATRMGITCEPICLDCAHSSEKIILRCRVEGIVDVYYIGISGSTFFDQSSIHPDLVDQSTSSFEVIFGHMLEAVVVRDRIRYRTCPYIDHTSRQSEICKDDLRSSLRLVCVFWPVYVNVSESAKLCLETNDQIDDAYQLLLSAEIDNNDPVMTGCLQKLKSQQEIMDAAKMARHRSPSIFYAIGLVMYHNYKDAQGVMRDMICVIISWDECFREEVSRQKWGLSFTPVTDGYRLNQPFYHIMCYYPPNKYFYVPQETLRLCFNVGVPSLRHVERFFKGRDLCIFFERFDGGRFFPNAQHKAHFPQDDAVASAWHK